MPGAVEMDCKMEKNKKSRRKRVTPIEQDCRNVVAGVFTLEEAYGKHKRSKLNGEKSSNFVSPSKLDVSIRNAAVNSRLNNSVVRNRTDILLSSEKATGVYSRPNSVVSNRADILSSNEKAILSSEKATGVFYQESCITEDESGSDNSRDIQSSKLAILQSASSVNDSAQKEAGGGKKRGRTEEDVNAEGEDREFGKSQVKVQKLTEEARVWQYVCKRSVFVSPPQRPKLPDKKDSRFPSGSAPSRSIPTEYGVNDVFRDKTVNLEVAVNDKIVKVTLTKESSVAQEWIEQQTGNYFGLDVEWKPTFRRGQKESKVALMQISSETECLLVQMLFLDSIPSALVQLLEDPELKIAGVGIHDDTKKLVRDFGLVCGGEVELTTLAVNHYKNDKLKRVGLKALAKHVLGYDMNKCKAVTMSNWSNAHLNRRQVEYACIDAWVSHAIFGRLQKSLLVAA